MKRITVFVEGMKPHYNHLSARTRTGEEIKIEGRAMDRVKELAGQRKNFSLLVDIDNGEKTIDDPRRIVKILEEETAPAATNGSSNGSWAPEGVRDLVAGVGKFMRGLLEEAEKVSSEDEATLGDRVVAEHGLNAFVASQHDEALRKQAELIAELGLKRQRAALEEMLQALHDRRGDFVTAAELVGATPPPVISCDGEVVARKMIPEEDPDRPPLALVGETPTNLGLTCAVEEMEQRGEAPPPETQAVAE